MSAISYNDWNEVELRNECQKRGLKTTGTKDSLVDRLEASDVTKRQMGEEMTKKRERDDGKTQEEKEKGLMRACLKGTLEEVCSALNHGAKENAYIKSISALMCACARGDDWKVAENIVEELLRRGALCDLQDEDGWTALHWAAEYSSAAVVNMLLEAKSRVNNLSDCGRTPLMVCCAKPLDDEGVEISRLLLDRAAKVEHKDEVGETALHLACYFGSAAMVQLLLDCKANVNAVNNKGYIPLMWACNNRFEGEAIIPILMAAGADPSLKNKAGETALTYAYHVGGSMMRAIAPLIAPNGQLANRVPALFCPDPIGSMREAIPYGCKPNSRYFPDQVKWKRPADYCWSILRVASLCLDSSNNDIFTVKARSDDVRLWYYVVGELLITRHPESGDTLLHVAARTNKSFALDILMRRQLNPFLLNYANEKPIDVATDKAIIAKLNAYSQFQPQQWFMDWMGPYFRRRVRAFLLVVLGLRTDGIVRFGRDVMFIILRHLARMEYV